VRRSRAMNCSRFSERLSAGVEGSTNGGRGAGAPAGDSSHVPQAMQKLAPGAAASPQAGQLTVRQRGTSAGPGQGTRSGRPLSARGTPGLACR
jgi:hypothetical protein